MSDQELKTLTSDEQKSRAGVAQRKKHDLALRSMSKACNACDSGSQTLLSHNGSFWPSGGENCKINILFVPAPMRNKQKHLKTCEIFCIDFQKVNYLIVLYHFRKNNLYNNRHLIQLFYIQMH